MWIPELEQNLNIFHTLHHTEAKRVIRYQSAGSNRAHRHVFVLANTCSRLRTVGRVLANGSTRHLTRRRPAVSRTVRPRRRRFLAGAAAA